MMRKIKFLAVGLFLIFLTGSNCGGVDCPSFDQTKCSKQADACVWKPEVVAKSAVCTTKTGLLSTGCPNASVGKKECEKITGVLQNCYYTPEVEGSAAHCEDKSQPN